MSDTSSALAVQLSSELISEIVQEYFDKKLFKRKVEILDLKPTSDGYAFMVDFVVEKPNGVKTPSQSTQHVTVNGATHSKRNSQGQFTKAG